MLLKPRQTRQGADSWLDTATVAERGGEAEQPKRSLQALRVFRLRIERLMAEREELRARVAALEADIVRGDREARDEGFEAGRLEGRVEAERELAAGFELLGTMEREFRRAAGRYHREADCELVGLARWMAERVVQREIVLDERRLERVAGALIDHWTGEGVYRFRLHPADRRTLLASPAAERLRERAGGRIEWVDAPEVPPGGCRLELASGLVDAAPDEMLRHLEQALLKELARRPDGELAPAPPEDSP